MVFLSSPSFRIIAFSQEGLLLFWNFLLYKQLPCYNKEELVPFGPFSHYFSD